MKCVMNRLSVVAVTTAMFFALQCYGYPPPNSIGVGYSDLSDITGIASPDNIYRLAGSLSFTGYGDPQEVVIPPEMRYMSFYMYGKGFESTPFCGATGRPVVLCNFSVTPGQPLASAIAQIPAQFSMPNSRYLIKAQNLNGICGGWVLSNGTNAAQAQYSIGSFLCGVRPSNTVCDITPAEFNINLTVTRGAKAMGGVNGTVSCNRTANIRVSTPLLPDSLLHLGTKGVAPVAALTINDRPSGEGVDMTVRTGAELSIMAAVDNTNIPGQYSGSTALVIEYL